MNLESVLDANASELEHYDCILLWYKLRKVELLLTGHLEQQFIESYVQRSISGLPNKLLLK
ncbi:hypothetical protein PMSD_26560 [Paenibacillus macquariensis subsp. defensor]|nr:hypothetical protein PMSD_26560 [Paenibacillus macquariensis subsp. defensor]